MRVFSPFLCTGLVRTLGFGLLVTGCNPENIAIVRDQNDPSTVFWQAQLNHHAATLSTFAPWDTMQVSTSAIDGEGRALDLGNSTFVYESADSNVVSVTPSGFVRAKGTTSGTQIFARLTLGSVTRSDTLIVKVVNNPAPKQLAVFSIQPGPNDSAKVASTSGAGLNSLQQLLRRTATDSTQMTDLIIYYKSLDPYVLVINRQTGAFSPFSRTPGRVKVVASTYAYGVGRADTLMFTVGYPLRATSTFKLRPLIDSLGLEMYIDAGNPITVGVGADVTFTNSTERDVHLVFDDTTAMQIVQPAFPDEPMNRILPDIRVGQSDGTSRALRRFIRAGRFTYRDMNSGVIGTIEVGEP